MRMKRKLGDVQFVHLIFDEQRAVPRFNYAAQLGDGDNEVNLFQFMQLQMLKRGISWEEIEQLTHRFNEIDLDQSTPPPPPCRAHERASPPHPTHTQTHRG